LATGVLRFKAAVRQDTEYQKNLLATIPSTNMDYKAKESPGPSLVRGSGTSPRSWHDICRSV